MIPLPNMFEPIVIRPTVRDRWHSGRVKTRSRKAIRRAKRNKKNHAAKASRKRNR